MDISTVTQALMAAIVADSDFQGVVVERDEFVNQDADQARVGWIGIYRQSVEYEPLTLAAGRPERYDANPIKLLLVVQTWDSDSGAACADRLEAHIKNLFDLLLNNDSISSTIDRIQRMRIDYGYEPKSERGKLYFQSAYITLELETANA